MMGRFLGLFFGFFPVVLQSYGQSGQCNSGVPFTALDLTGSPDSVYISPPITRNDLCCGSSNPDRCLEFEITLDSGAVGINFEIYSGAAPSGALYYQINCGPLVPVGNPICLGGTGPHTLTFCKPGNNTNRYSITSIKGFTQGLDISTVEGCDAQLMVDGLLESTIVWTDLTGGGYYNDFLSCDSGCSDVTFNSQQGFPSFIDFQVCGTLFSGSCQSIMDTGCDTVRMNINPSINVAVTPSPPAFCSTDLNRTLSAYVTPVKTTYNLFWTNGPDGTGTIVSTDTFYEVTAAGTYSIVVVDTEFAECSADTINFPVVFNLAPTVTATSDTGFCTGYGVKLFASGAQSYEWSPPTDLSCSTCASAWASPPVSRTYVVTGTASNGCTDTDTVNISVHYPTSLAIDSTICSGDIVMVGSSQYATTGISTDTLTTNFGCDSVVTLDLTVLPVPDTAVSVSFCDGESFTVGSSVYTAAGVYQDTLPGAAANGCDSIVVTTIQIRYPAVTLIDTAFCAGETITVGGSVYSATGNYTDTLVRANGCDSVITTNLVVHSHAFVTLNPQICAGETFVTGSSSYSSSGTYYDTLFTAAGCDSVIQTNLVVKPVSNITLDSTICPGGFVIVGTSVYSTTGTYTDTLTKTNGCDSIVTLNLTVASVATTNLNITMCQGDSFTVGGSVYVNAGVYTNTLTSANGCDSIVVTGITLLNPRYVTLNPFICAGDSFTTGSSVYTTAGTFYDTLMASNGCDSIITTNLTVLTHQFAAINASICTGDSFTVGNSVYSAGGTYNDTLTASNGCDSIITLNLAVLPVAFTSLNTVICQGDSFAVGSSVYTNTGNYTDTLTAANGCDSIVDLTLNVLPVTYNALAFVICPGDSVVIGSSVYSSAGIYADVFTGSNGCDSVVTTTVTVNNVVFTALSPVLCAGTTITVGGSVYGASGTYYDTLTGANGCDSIITTTLTVVNPKLTTVNATICDGENYTVGASSYTASGTSVDTLIAATGCDSIVTLNLTVLPVPLTSLNTTICQYDNMTVGTSVYTTSGSYADTLTAANGCDSIVTLNLNVLPVNTETVTIHICQGDSALVGGTFYYDTGIYYDTVAGTNGCDSIVVINIFRHNPVSVTTNPALCLGSTFTVGSTTYTATGVYQDTLSTFYGCDSIITTNLTIADSLFVTLNTTICSNESLTVGTSTYTSAGTYYDTLTIPGICDSVVFTILNVLPISQSTQNMTICDGETATVGTSSYTAGGTYVDTLISANGCDSIVTLNLTVLPVSIDTLIFDICEGDSAMASTSVYFATGTYYDTLTKANGCDSVFVSFIQVRNRVYHTITTSICSGDSIHVGSSAYTATGAYQDTLIGANGCDSVITTNLAVINPKYVTLNPAICSGENFTVGSSVYTTSGAYSDTLIAATGCDSIVQTNLTVKPVKYTALNNSICQGEVVTVGTSTYGSSGNYADTLNAANGCDSIVTLALVVRPVSVDTLLYDICEGDSVVAGSSVYFNAGTYYDTLAKGNGCDSVIVSSVQVRNRVYTAITASICLGDLFNVSSSSYTTAGTYRDTLTGSNGCDSVITTNLGIINPKYTILNPAVCFGGSFTIGSSTYTSTGTYFDTLAAASGCDSIVETNLLVRPLNQVTIDSAICQGDFILVGTSLYFIGGTYTNTLTGTGGCDSTVTLNLTVRPIPVTRLNRVICQGDSVVVGSSVYFNAGTYNNILTNQYGCDSVVITTITVRNHVFTALNPVRCAGNAFTVGSSVYYTTGTYYDTLIAVNGCDSIITTQLTVIAPKYATVNATICSDESFTVGSSVYTAAGTYVDTIPAASGCDSIVTLNLSVLPTSVITVNTGICEGDSVVTGSSIYYYAGTYYDTLIKTNGCDSVIITSVSVISRVYTTVSPSVCAGESFTTGSSSYTTTGSYFDTLVSQLGCDSIVTTHLTVHPHVNSIADISICTGDSITVGSNVYSSAGTYVDTLQSAAGCDSVVQTNLQLLPVFVSDIDSVICPGEIVTVGTSTYSIDGNYSDTLIAQNGCDSVVNLNLIIHQPATTQLNVTLCYGNTFFLGYEPYYQSGFYVDTFTDAFGCDSVVELSLVISPLVYNVVDTSLCEDEIMWVGSSAYAAAGTYFDTLFSAYGCDSIVETRLSFRLKSFAAVNPVICSGEQYVIGTSIYTIAGTYTDTLQSANGCDSIVTSTLTLLPSYFINIDTAFCGGNSITVGSSTYAATGIYFDTLSTVTGCDSVIRTDLTVFPVINESHNRYMCRGDTLQFYFPGGVQYQWMNPTSLSCSACPDPRAYPYDDITYLLRTTDINGCNSYDTVGINVGFIEASINLSDSAVCEGENLTFTATFNADEQSIQWLWSFGDGFLSVNQNPVYSFVDSGTFEIQLTATNSRGCAVTDFASVTVHPNPDILISSDTVICEGDTAMLRVSGADSYQWLPLSFLDDPNSSSPVTVPTSTINYTVTGFSQNGCQSLANVLVVVNPLPFVQTSPDTSICVRTSAALSAYGGIQYTWSAADSFTMSGPSQIVVSPAGSTLFYVEVVNQYGCKTTDSILVEVHPEIQFRVSPSGDLCMGETIPLTAEGAVSYSWYPPNGLSCSSCDNPDASPNSSITYNVIATDIYGCIYEDSIALAVRSNPAVSTIQNLTICRGEEVVLHTDTAMVSSFNWTPSLFLENPGQLSPVATPPDSAAYVVSVVNQYGCQKSDTVEINVIERVEAGMTGDDEICTGAQVTIAVEVDDASSNGYQIRWTPSNYFNNQNLNPQLITLTDDLEVTAIVTSQTCVADTIHFNIEVNEPPSVDAGEGGNVYVGERVNLYALSPQTIESYQWSSSELLTCDSCWTTQWIADQSRSFTVRIVDENGCAALDTVFYNVTGHCKDDIFIPNAFTPNGDELNDRFYVRSIHEISLEYFRIFDRWGAEVYSSNDIDEGWDGTHPAGWNGFYNSNVLKGGEAALPGVVPGVYVYVLKVGCRNGQNTVLSGNVTLIR